MSPTRLLITNGTFETPYNIGTLAIKLTRDISKRNVYSEFEENL